VLNFAASAGRLNTLDVSDIDRQLEAQVMQMWRVMRTVKIAPF
jgi:hypothetical protein